MSNADGSLDIDMFLVRLNKSIPEPVAKWMTFVLPVLSLISLMSTIVMVIIFRRQKNYTGLQRIVSCILVLTTLCLAVRIPLSIILLGNDGLYTDYLEYKWCEVFTRLNVDTPTVINIINALLKVGLAVQGLIMMFAPKKAKVLMTSRKTIWFCFFTCIVGVCVYIPAMYLITFLPVPWTSKYRPDTERECCVPFPGDHVINIEFYQRDAYLGILCVAHAFPIATMLSVGVILTVRLYMLKRTSQTDDAVEQKEHIRAISLCMFVFPGLDLPTAIQILLITLTYGLVDIGVDINTTQDIVSYFGLVETICSAFVPVITLFIFCLCDTRIRTTFMQLLRRRNT
ncbi:uncharacterized protein LOC132551525 [Ylistrum balloti]|uniref:uncharacterized protein LOC132551525 n=1 Tax=Ylistrum balloti TaxID=509963 RepID=UPI0029059FAF|nr:uncharacterized protein LOC132551525 [Ylistrum balloti]